MSCHHITIRNNVRAHKILSNFTGEVDAIDFLSLRNVLQNHTVNNPLPNGLAEHLKDNPSILDPEPPPPRSGRRRGGERRRRSLLERRVIITLSKRVRSMGWRWRFSRHPSN